MLWVAIAVADGGQAASAAQSGISTYGALQSADDYNHPVIDGLGWRDAVTDRERNLEEIGYWGALLTRLKEQHGVGVLAVEEVNLAARLLAEQDNPSLEALQSVLRQLLLVDGGPRLAQLTPYLQGLREDFRELQATRVPCASSAASLDTVQALITPYLKDGWEHTYLVQMQLVLDYDVSRYAHESLGTEGLPEHVAKELQQIASPGRCLTFNELQTARFWMQEVLPGATQRQWRATDFPIEEDPQRWLSQAIAQLDPGKIHSAEMIARQRLMELLSAARERRLVAPIE